MKEATIYFESISLDHFEKYRGGTAFIDIDHTLLSPGSEEVSLEVKKQLKLLNSIFGKIYLVSNGGRHIRNRKIAEENDVVYLEVPYRKPNPKVVSGLNIEKPCLVIGDKVLIDGIFAKLLKADFIKVSRYVSSKDSLIDKFICVLDDIFSYIL